MGTSKLCDIRGARVWRGRRGWRDGDLVKLPFSVAEEGKWLLKFFNAEATHRPTDTETLFNSFNIYGPFMSLGLAARCDSTCRSDRDGETQEAEGRSQKVWRAGSLVLGLIWPWAAVLTHWMARLPLPAQRGDPDSIKAGPGLQILLTGGLPSAHVREKRPQKHQRQTKAATQSSVSLNLWIF